MFSNKVVCTSQLWKEGNIKRQLYCIVLGLSIFAFIVLAECIQSFMLLRNLCEVGRLRFGSWSLMCSEEGTVAFEVPHLTSGKEQITINTPGWSMDSMLSNVGCLVHRQVMVGFCNQTLLIALKDHAQMLSGCKAQERKCSFYAHWQGEFNKAGKGDPFIFGELLMSHVTYLQFSVVIGVGLMYYANLCGSLV